jgi:hypothetical protein
LGQTLAPHRPGTSIACEGGNRILIPVRLLGHRFLLGAPNERRGELGS